MPRWGQAIWSGLRGFCALSPASSAFYPAALDQDGPSVDDNDGDGEDEYNCDKQVKMVKSSKGGRSQGLEPLPKGLSLQREGSLGEHWSGRGRRLCPLLQNLW